ncbi:hypothetical protein ACFTXB_28045 [Streptomyces sp. NPDC057074]|uniref:hypothetical protein n=1 Tax=Streptomyces sp. NPDC057074 TaxID=3346015 RepID=UPI00362F8801
MSREVRHGELLAVLGEEGVLPIRDELPAEAAVAAREVVLLASSPRTHRTRPPSRRSARPGRR